MKRWLTYNALSIVVLLLFLVFWAAQSAAGYRSYNDEQVVHGNAPVSYGEYLQSGEFIEATFENWESEFLQMGAYVVLTAFLLQKGSAESKKLRGSEPEDREPRSRAARTQGGPDTSTLAGQTGRLVAQVLRKFAEPGVAAVVSGVAVAACLRWGPCYF
jgi:hypothetical protein